LDYDDHGIPREIKNLGAVEMDEKKLAVRIVYGNYYERDNMKAVWDQVKRYSGDGGPLFGVPLNSSAVTDLNGCLYLAGFESDGAIPGLNTIAIDGGRYIRADYQGNRDKLGETYTWILKYYLPQKGLKYDYRPQLQEYAVVPDFDRAETSCALYIPIGYA
jgi:AraC family transcriptional regulator